MPATSPTERPQSSAPQVFGVDPDVVTRGLLALYLEPLGLAVRLTGALPDALAQLDRELPRAYICAESALTDAEPRQREQLRERLSAVPVVVLLEPGAAPVWTRGWPNVLERLTKPVCGETLLAIAASWMQRPAGRGAKAETGAPAECLAGLEAMIVELGMEPGLVQELVRSFAARTPQYLADLRVALAAQDTGQVRRILHAMTGMCANLRLDPLVALTAQVREAVGMGDLAAAGAACGRLEERCAQVFAAAGARWNAAK